MYGISDLENRLAPSERMPVLFVGHGTPMNAIQDNEYSRTDRTRPRAAQASGDHRHLGALAHPRWHCHH